MRSAAIRSWGLMISAKTWLKRVSDISNGSYFFGCVLWVLVELILLLIYFMWPFAVAKEVGRCFMSSTFRLGHAVKWTFLMAWSKILFTGIKRAAWYHLASSGLLLASREFSADGCCWLGDPVGLLVRLTCHIPDVDDLFPSSTVIPSLTTLR